MSLTIASMVLTGLPLVVLVPMWIVSLINNRQHGDSARRGAGWLKAVFPFLIIGILCELAAKVVTYVVYYGDDAEVVYPLYVGLYFQSLAVILTFIVMIEAGLGFLYVRSKNFVAAQPPVPGAAKTKSMRPSSHKIVRAIAYTLAACLLAIATTVFGLRVGAFAWYERELEEDGYYRDLISEVNGYFYKALKADAAFDIVCWALTLPLLGFAGSVVSKCKGSVVARSTHVYIAAVCVWFVRFLWRMIYQAGYELPQYSEFDPRTLIIVDPIFTLWLFTIVLILLYVVFAANQTGIWSIARPWMSYQQPIYPQPGYEQPEYAYAPPPDSHAYRSPAPNPDGQRLHEMHQTPSPIYANTAVSGVSTPPVAEVKG